MTTRQRVSYAFVICAIAATAVFAARPGFADLPINGSFEAPSGYFPGTQGVMPPDWQVTIPTPDLYSSDGSFGLAPSAFNNFPGVTAQSGLGWVAGWTGVNETFSQQLAINLVPGATYSLTAWMIQAKRADLDSPGGYHIYLAPTNSLASAELVATLDPTTNLDEWEFREENFIAPANSNSLPWIIFRPYLPGAGGAYPGLDNVNLTLVPQTVSWVGGGSGLWDDPANWSSGQVPTVNDAVVINDPNASLTITLGAGSFAVASLERNESLVISENATLTVSGNITIHNATVENGGLFEVAAVDSDTQLLLMDGSTFHNLPGGGMGLPGFPPSFGFNVIGSGQFINDGLLYVHSGSFNMAVGGSSSGTFEILGSSTLQFGGGYIFDDGTELCGDGVIQLLAPTDPCRCVGAVTLNGVNVENSGLFELSPADGTAEIVFVDGANLNNLPGGNMGMPGFPPQFNFNFGGDGFFTNDGLLYVHSGSFNVAVAGSSSGTFEILGSSTLQFGGGYIFDDGTEFCGGGVVQLLAPVDPCRCVGDMTLNGVNVEISGLFELSPIDGTANIVFVDGANLNNLPGGNMGMPGFPPQFNFNFGGNGFFINDGLLYVHSGSFHMAVGGSSDGGTFQVASESALHFNAGFDLNDGTNLTGDGAVLVQLLGEPDPNVPPNPTRVNGEVSATNLDVGSFGVLDVSGSLDVASGLNVLAAGTLSGSGTVSGGVSNAGFLLPGSSPGRLTIVGNYLQTAQGLLQIEIGGTDVKLYDQLSVDGNVSLDGTLEVTLVAPFMLGNGQQFNVIDATGNITGQFFGLADDGVVANFGDTDLFIDYADDSIALYTDANVILLGDVNLDGVVNLLDVNPFVERLTTGVYQAEADTNEDGSVNLLDVQPFIALLTGS